MKIPVVDMAECVDCEGCLEVCPEVFFKNQAGLIEVRDLTDYPVEAVDEAIMYCPADCIIWEEDNG